MSFPSHVTWNRVFKILASKIHRNKREIGIKLFFKMLLIIVYFGVKIITLARSANGFVNCSPNTVSILVQRLETLFKFYKNFTQILSRISDVRNFWVTKSSHETELRRMTRHFELITQQFLLKSSFELLTQLRVTKSKIKLLYFYFRLTNSKLKNKKLHFELLTRRWNFYFFTFQLLAQGLNIKKFTLSN